MKKIFYCLLIASFSLSCTKKSTNDLIKTDPPVDTVTHSIPYKIIEDFEFGSKKAYLSGDAVVKTGTWVFDDAILSSTVDDTKTGTQSVRLRTGKISMKFDIDSISMIKFSHAQYGSDASSELSLWASTNQGATYFKIGSNIATNTHTFATDSFEVNFDKKVRFEIRKSGSNSVNIDDIIFTGFGDPHISFNSPPDVDDPNAGGGGNGGGTPGTGVDTPPTTGDDSNLLLGNPSNALPDVVMRDNYMIDQKYYVESYSATRGTPNWVSWHLDYNSVGNTSRQNDFNAFTGLPSNFYHVQDFSYSGSGFDRGHNCPSADRTSSAEANSSTFLMTNMIPQAPNNNQKAWANLENYLRSEMQKGNEVYIIMGSYGKGGTGSKGMAETIDNGNVIVPNRVWKIAVILTRGNNDLARVTSSTRVLAVDTPNDQTVGDDWTPYITTVDAVEATTGFDLLSNLPTSVQATLEAKRFVK